MPSTVFVDGQVGTTGLRILDQLAHRPDLELLLIDEEKRRDVAERKRLLNEADFAILCLPDDAAIEADGLIAPDNDRTRILDASTAHRTHPDWAYGIPELSSSHREAIAGSARVANPGCHASGFNLLVYPLLQAGLIPADHPLTCTSLTGYSGGGKQMIADYEEPADEGQTALCRGSRPYALSLAHKHLPEMTAVAGLEFPPLFVPVVGAFHSGMIVSVPLLSRTLPGKPRSLAIADTLSAHYEGERFVQVRAFEEIPSIDGGVLNPQALNGTNELEIFVFGNDDQIHLCARLDNLGKGASGAAVQNLNLMMGAEESTGL